jgi:hypothetical protein
MAEREKKIHIKTRIEKDSITDSGASTERNDSIFLKIYQYRLFACI